MIKFELTEEDMKVLSEALANMPFGRVVGLIQKLQVQLSVQKGEPEKSDNVVRKDFK